MSYLSSFFLVLCLILITVPSYSTEQIIHNQNNPNSTNETSSISGTRLIIESEPLALIANKTVTIRFKLLRGNKTLTLNDLKEVHTQKIHLLMIDPSFIDYHHIHPIENNKTKDFIFNFTPKNNSYYRMWADVTPLATNKQEFVMADLGTPSKDTISIEKNLKLNSNVGPYNFTLKLDKEPKAGQEIMATIDVTKNGIPFTQLEPIMGAFAHAVGFGENYSSILHIHPMGTATCKSSDRGGPQLMFHIRFKEAGFVKLFIQVRINREDVYVPFGVFVK